MAKIATELEHNRNRFPRLVAIQGAADDGRLDGAATGALRGAEVAPLNTPLT
jgi:hypothetical protein